MQNTATDNTIKSTVTKRPRYLRTTVCNLAFLILIPSAIGLANMFGSAVLFLLSVFILPFVIAFFNPVRYTKDRKCFDGTNQDITEDADFGALAWLIFIVEMIIVIACKGDIALFLHDLGAGQYKVAVISFVALLIPISILIITNVPIAVCLQKDPYAPKTKSSAKFDDTHRRIEEENRKRDALDRSRCYYDPSYSYLPYNSHHRR